MTIIQHKVIPDAQLHEPKGIVNSTGDKVYVSDGLGSGTWQKITSSQVNAGASTSGQILRSNGTGAAAWASLTDADMTYTDKTKNKFGWNYIEDSLYTSGAPRTILTGVRTQLTNNGLGSNTDQSRLGALWNTATNNFLFNDPNAFYISRLTLHIKTTAVVGTPYIVLFEYQGDLGPLVFTANTYTIKGGSNQNSISITTGLFVRPAINNVPVKIFVTPDCDITLYDVSLTVDRTYVEQ